MKTAVSPKDLCKVKNNISSGKYRKRKADERMELQRKIAQLEERNRLLTQQVEKNTMWFKKARELFPEVPMPW